MTPEVQGPTGIPYIPENIVVHLGRPDQYAQNVTVSFPDYIKNVASSEIYPTWPESALRANIYAQISFALNRVYTEWYRSQGYDFDITSSTAYDQSFVNGRNIFDNIDALVDEIFNDYLRRQGTLSPLFAQYCNGTTVTCEGLSQWGSVDLANQGYTPYEILQYYYGDDIDIVRDAPVRTNIESYPGTPIRRGDTGNYVRNIQMKLNRVSADYPAIPKINPVDGIFGENTEEAVKAFQRIFNLTPDGIVGKGTWYRLQFIHTSVRRLAELQGEGITLADLPKQYQGELRPGDPNDAVKVLQYFLAYIGFFNNAVPFIDFTGKFDAQTENAVRAFQAFAGLPVTGVVDEQTWNEIYEAYAGIIQQLPPQLGGTGLALYPGTPLRRGSTGQAVFVLQAYLTNIAHTYPEIPPVEPTGVFDQLTEQAVRAYQNAFGLEVDGIVGPVTWDSITNTDADLRAGNVRSTGQFPGAVLGT